MESSLHTQTLEIRRRLSEHHLRVSGKRSLSRPNGHSGPVTGTFEQVHLPTAGLSAAKATAPNAAAAMIRKEIIMSDYTPASVVWPISDYRIDGRVVDTVFMSGDVWALGAAPLLLWRTTLKILERGYPWVDSMDRRP